MKPGLFNWEINAGDDESVVFTFRDLTYDATRVWTAQVRRNKGDSGTPEATIGIAASANVDGRQVVAIALTDTQTRALGDINSKRPCFYWDLQVVEDAVTTTTVIAGTVRVEMDVTR